MIGSVPAGPGKPNNWQLPVTMACVLLGVLVSLQFRAQRDIHAAPHDKDLIAMTKGLETENNKLRDELTKMRNRIDDMEQSGKGQSVLKAQLADVKVQAGLVGLKGPGMEIRVDDSNHKPGPSADPYFFLVHDVDLQALVNELWSAGAEAVVINDQRMVNRSSIRCAGPIILVNAVRQAPPYVVHAIGPVDALDRALRMPGGWLDSMAPLLKNGGEVKISKLNEVTIPAYSGSLGFRYAQPVPQDEDTQQPTTSSGQQSSAPLNQALSSTDRGN